MDAAAELGRNLVSTKLSLRMEMSRLTRDGTAEPISRDQILEREREQGKVHFPCPADHVQDWQPYPVNPYSAAWDDHTYMYTFYNSGIPLTPLHRRILLLTDLFFYNYRKYRSLGTPPRLTFQARLLHNQEDVNTDRYVKRQLSTRSFENRPFQHLAPSCCGAFEPGKSVLGVCQDSDTYSI